MNSGWKVALIAGIAIFGLQSCTDFRPLYGTDGALEGSSVVTELSNIDIPEPSSRIQQLIRNHLITTMSPPGQEGNGRYQLVVTPASSDFDVIVERNTDVRRRFYRLTVAFLLKDGHSGRKIYGGNTFSEVYFDKVTSGFTTLNAKNNAEKRAAREVGDDIRTRLASFFATRGSS